MLKLEKKTPVEASIKEQIPQPKSLLQSLTEHLTGRRTAMDEDEIGLEDTQSVWSEEDTKDTKKPKIVVTEGSPENKTPKETKSILERVATSVLGLSPRATAKDLERPLSPLPETVELKQLPEKGKGKAKDLTELENLIAEWNENKETKETLTEKFRDYTLDEEVDLLPQSVQLTQEEKDEILRSNVVSRVNELWKVNPEIPKVRLIEELIRSNPDHKMKY